MTKKNTALAEMLASEKKKLETMERKRKDLDAKIKITKAKIKQYEMMNSSAKFNTIATALDEQGLSMEEVMAAIATGDFMALQEKMEAANSPVEEDTEKL